MKKTDPIGSFVNHFGQISVLLSRTGNFLRVLMNALVTCYLILAALAFGAGCILLTGGTIYLLGAL